MVKSKKQLLFILCAIFWGLVFSFNVIAHASYTDEMIFYKIDNNEVTITAGGNSNDVIIPDYIEAYPVTKIASKALFLNEHYTSITLPNTLITIEYMAIAGCEGIKEIIIPKNVNNIGYYALGYMVDPTYEYSPEGLITKLDNFIIKGYKGTAAETYAIENGFDFIALDDISDTTSSEDNEITAPNNVTATMYGDVNLDKIVNVADVVMLNMFFSNSTENPIESDVSLANADCLKDNYINTSDATLIMNYVAMKISIDNLGK